MAELFNGARPLVPVSERDSLKKAILKMKARRNGDIKSLKSAWPKFNDAFCDGLEWRTITVVGARPGTGKTLFMEQLIDDIIKINKVINNINSGDELNLIFIETEDQKALNFIDSFTMNLKNTIDINKYKILDNYNNLCFFLEKKND